MAGTTTRTPRPTSTRKSRTWTPTSGNTSAWTSSWSTVNITWPTETRWSVGVTEWLIPTSELSIDKTGPYYIVVDWACVQYLNQWVKYRKGWVILSHSKFNDKSQFPTTFFFSSFNCELIFFSNSSRAVDKANEYRRCLFKFRIVPFLQSRSHRCESVK